MRPNLAQSLLKILQLFTLTGLLAACSSASPPRTSAGPAPLANDPNALLAILAGKDTPEDSRRSADARLAQLKGKTDPARLAVLEQILYAPGHSDAMRIYALDQLAAADPAGAAQTLILYLPRLEGPVLAHACEVAVQLGDPRIENALIRSLDRPLFIDSPEVPALEKLAGKSLPETLYTALEKELDASVRIAALDILQQILPPVEVIARIKKMDASSDWLGDLRWWADKMNALPMGENENIWIHQLAQPQNAALFNRALARHQKLKDEPDYTLAPRFIAALANIDDRTAQISREDLLKDLAAKLPAATPPDQSLPANEKNLTRCDLLTLELLLAHLSDPAVLAELQRQGLADLADPTTKHGGVILLQNQKLIFRDYPAVNSDKDSQYTPDDSATRDTVLGLAQYRFHFQQIHNAPRSAPIPAELAYTRTARANALLITSIDTRKMNLTLYTPAGAVINLGDYEAPK